MCKCPLCLSADNDLFSKDDSREYRKCNVCSLIFVPSNFHLSLSDEKSRYDHHDNSYNNIGYRKYLEGVASEIESVGINFSSGDTLDYGSGKERVLSRILEDRGYSVTSYDPLYGLNIQDDQTFDNIIVIEAIEHFVNVNEELETMLSHLKDSGKIFVQTKMYNEEECGPFVNWWYKRDITHISFFSPQSVEWIEKRFDLKATHITGDCFVLER